MKVFLPVKNVMLKSIRLGSGKIHLTLHGCVHASMSPRLIFMEGDTDE